MKSFRVDVVGWIGLICTILFATVYFYTFSENIFLYDSETGYFRRTLNYPDHLIYTENMQLLKEGAISLDFANDKGIAFIYLALEKVFPFFREPHYVFLPFFFNILVLCLCYYVYAKICTELNLGWMARATFFANAYLIYFAQLINKDMLTVLVFLTVAYWGMRKKWIYIVLLTPLFMLIRVQFAIFIFVFLLLSLGRRTLLYLMVCYVGTSLVAAYASVHFPVVGEDSLGGGFSSWVIGINSDYLLGYLLFNPIRVVQYIFDAYLSFNFLLSDGGVDMAKILRIPQLLLLLCFGGSVLSLVLKFKYWLTTPAKSLVLVTISYFLAWLMNPTVNARYVMIITPILMLFAMYAAKDRSIQE